MTKQTEIGVVEMGANHSGEIRAYCEIAKPDFAIITNIGKAHLEGFGSLEGVRAAKGELFEWIAKTNGHVFFNSDNQIISSLVFQHQITKTSTYSVLDNANIRGKIIRNSPFIQIEWFEKNVEKSTIQTQLIGSYNLENILASISVGIHFGIDKTKINNAIENYKPVNNRSQWIKTSKNTILLDAYNANPTSMIAAISNFLEMNLDNKLLILGDMLELGYYTGSEHNNIIKHIIESNYTGDIILVGQNFRNAADNNNDLAYEWFINVNELINRLKIHPFMNKNILIKASRGIQLEKAAELL